MHTITKQPQVLRALIIDDDEGTRILLSNYLKQYVTEHAESDEAAEAGVEVVTAADGLSAWEHLQAGNFNLIFLDWKLPKLSGLALFNRLRSLPAYQTTPVVVVSGYVERLDFRLLQEFPCSVLIEKPFTAGIFATRIEMLLREAEWYEQNVTLVDTILRAAEHDAKQCEVLIRDVLKKAPNPIPLALLAARRLTKVNLTQVSEKILRAVLNIDQECIMAMAELGKLLHQNGKHSEALDVLRQANKISPQNMKRLCLMGEAELNLGDPETAKRYFSEALTIDDKNKAAQDGVVVASNMIDLKLAEVSPVESLPSNFASLLNTIGITLVRNGQFDRGIEQYQAAMSFLPSAAQQARVAFNLGLGYLRWGKSSDALPWFQRSQELGGHEFNRSERYVTRLAAADKTSAGEQTLQEMAADAPAAMPTATEAAEMAIAAATAAESSDDLAMGAMAEEKQRASEAAEANGDATIAAEASTTPAAATPEAATVETSTDTPAAETMPPADLGNVVQQENAEPQPMDSGEVTTL